MEPVTNQTEAERIKTEIKAILKKKGPKIEPDLKKSLAEALPDIILDRHTTPEEDGHHNIERSIVNCVIDNMIIKNEIKVDWTKNSNEATFSLP